MDLHIGQVTAEVRAVDDRTLVSPEVIEVVVAEVLRRLESRQSSDAARRAETALWTAALDAQR